MRQWEIDSIASALGKTMPDLCNVYRRTGNADEYGGGDELVEVISDLKVAIAPTDYFQYQQAVAASSQADIVYYSLAFPRASAIREGDLVDIYTQGSKVTIMQVERTESWDTMVRCYGQVIDDDGWFELNFHSGGHS